MNKSWWIAATAACGMIVPAPVLAQDKPAAPAKRPAQAPAETTSQIKDVALSKEGAFTGRVIDDKGQPLDGVVVKLVRGEKEVATTNADAQGRFKFASLKGGVYQVQTPQSQATYRLWSADVAPAQAMKTVVMNGASPIVRGQLDATSLAALVVGVVGVALAGVAVYKLNDLEDDVSKIPTSP